MVTPIQLINAYAALANGGTLYRPQVVHDIVGPDGTWSGRSQPEVIREMKVPGRSCAIMRNAARSTVTLRHTYNLVDLPIKVAGKSGTAEFGLRDSKGRLPYSSWFVGFVPKDAETRVLRRPRAPTWSSWPSPTTRGPSGNVATEIVKYYLQLHFDIKKDYRLPDLLKRGNFYQSD